MERLSLTAEIDCIEDDRHDFYHIDGTGNLDNCKSKLRKSIKKRKTVEVCLRGKFDKIEDGCFSDSCIICVSLGSVGSYLHIGNNCFCSSKLERVSIPETLETIGHYNFCGRITSFNIPSKIVDFPVDNLICCDELSSITVSEGNTTYKVVDGVLYNQDMTSVIFCPNAKKGKIVLPNTVKHIGEYCFYRCRSLEGVVIPPSVESIGRYAFSESSFVKLVIPNSVKTIEDGCFKKTVISDSLRISSQITILSDEIFQESSIGQLFFPFRNVTDIKPNAMSRAKVSIMSSSISFESVENLGASAFEGCNGTDNFEFYSCLQSIGEETFRNTNDNVKLRFNSYCPIRLSHRAFQGLSDRATLIVPKGTKIIFEHAAPWNVIKNIRECELDINLDENEGAAAVADDTHLARIKSVADSKIKADRYFLKEILEDLYQNYLFVDTNEAYDEAVKIIDYNRSFSPSIIHDMEQKMCAKWTTKYKAKLASKFVLDKPINCLSVSCAELSGILLAGDTLNLPKVDVSSISDNQYSPNIQVVFNEDILRQLQSLLTLARENLKIAVSWITNFSLFKQIKDMAMSGIKVQLITNNDLINNGGYCLNLNELIMAGVEISLVEYPHLLHHKFCIIDDDIVINGSYNWTRCSAKNYENIMIIRDNPSVTESFIDEFSNLQQCAELKCISQMPEYVPERPEYDRSAFKQYVTEELYAEACEASEERGRITAFQKAATLNPEYLETINPRAKETYAEAFDTIQDSVFIRKTIASLVTDNSMIEATEFSSDITKSDNKDLQNSSDPISRMSSGTVISKRPIMTRLEQSVIEKVKASELFMVLDVSGSMRETYNAGHVRNITKKALSASLAITDSKEVSLWTFGNDANFIANIGIESLSKIDQVICKKDGTKLSKFVLGANSTIKENALVIIFTDDDLQSIQTAIESMRNRSDVFWQIIVYDKSYENIEQSISDAENTSVVSLNDYESKNLEQIASILLKDYISWKKGR